MRFLLLILCLGLLVLTGCANVRQAYKDSPITPNGFNVTTQRDRKTGDFSDYFGFSWDLK